MLGPGLAGLALRRLLRSGPAMLTVVLGMVVSVALITAVPLYAGGFSDFLLRHEIERSSSPLASSVVIRHTEAWPREGDTDLAQYRRAARVFESQVADMAGLTERMRVHYLESDRIAQVEGFGPSGEELRLHSLVFGSLVAMTGLAEHIELLEGRLPSAQLATAQDPSGQSTLVIEGMMISRALDEHGLLVGDRIRLTHYDAAKDESFAFGVELVGRFERRDPSSIYWFEESAHLERGALFVDREALLSGLLALKPSLYGSSAWFSSFDPDAIRAANYQRVIGGLRRLDPLAAATLPNATVHTRLDRILVAADQQRSAIELTLFALSAPVVALVLAFMALSAGMVVDEQSGEIAMLKSRGAGAFQIVALYAVEGLLLGGLAMAVGPFLGMAFAQAMGKTLGFLEFTDRTGLRFELTASHYLLGAAPVALGILAMLGPVIVAAGRSVVTHRGEITRIRRKPLHQRYFLDFALLGAAIYGFVSLRTWDLLPALGPDAQPLTRSLLVIIPFAFILAMSLLFLRAVPWIVRFLAWAGSRVYGVGLFLSLRQVGRRPGPFTALLVLLIVTFAAGSFSASMAATINRNVEDRAFFRIGADAFFEEYGEFDPDRDIWRMPPTEGHLDVRADGAPAVEAAARLWSDEAVVRLSGGPFSYSRTATLYGVDPGVFANTVHWRRDFAPASLPALMNAMIRDDRALLVDRRLAAELPELQLGDPVQVLLGSTALDFFVAGWIDAFPTHYPRDGFFAVADLGYVERWVGQSPWDVLARLRPGVAADELITGLRELDFRVIQAFDAGRLIEQARNDATQVGTLGILTGGFAIAVLLTVVSLASYAVISFRRRLPEFGILRAIGLSRGQMVTLVTFENGLLVLLGTVVGTALGIVTGVLFIPFMQLGASEAERTPAYLAVTAWGDIGKLFVVLGVALALVLPLVVKVIRRVRTHEAIKFGGEHA